MVAKRRNRATASNAEFSTKEAAIQVPNDGHHRLNTIAVLQQLDPKEAARLIKATPVDPSTQIVRHLAIFRIVIYLLLVHVS
jgi:hypothetical protein